MYSCAAASSVGANKQILTHRLRYRAYVYPGDVSAGAR